MKKLFILGVSAMLMTGSVLTSCSKYEEGSKFTLLTKKARVVGDWTIESTESNGTVTPTASGVTSKMSFEKDGTSTSTYTWGSITSTSTGKWDFNADKDYIKLTDSQGTVTSLLIVELKSKEMKLKDESSSPAVTYKLVQ